MMFTIKSEVESVAFSLTFGFSGSNLNGNVKSRNSNAHVLVVFTKDLEQY